MQAVLDGTEKVEVEVVGKVEKEGRKVPLVKLNTDSIKATTTSVLPTHSPPVPISQGLSHS